MDEAPSPQTVLGELTLVELLTSGGMSHIFVAERRDGGRVGLKVLRRRHHGNRTLRARFRREASVGQLVRHPHIASTGALIEHGNELAFEIELLTGLDLADTLAFGSGSLAPRRVASLLFQVAEALGAAHAAGVVHRDLKPENVFVVHAPDGREIVKLIDFGFAWVPHTFRVPESERLTGVHEPIGTPEYMAPEQAYGAPGAPAADVYAFGVMAYELLGGQRPFRGTFPELVKLHSDVLPPPLQSVAQVSQRWAQLVHACLRKAPEERPTIAEVLSELEALRSTGS